MADKKTDASAGAKGRGRVAKFFRDVRSEFKKVAWPSKKQVWNNTVVVLITVAIFSVVIWGLDFLLTWLRDLLIGALSS